MRCEWCKRETPTRIDAPHKRFCCNDCRMEWHKQRRRDGEAALRERESHEPQKDREVDH